jgi:hypothetical protein
MSLSDYFRAEAQWRRGRADEFPEDERNEQSAVALESLAEYVEREDAAQFVGALEPYLFEGVDLGGEEVRRVVSRYGFGYNATTPVMHAAFLEELAVLCAVDAYELVRETGDEDPSGTLFDFELDAAREGVFLPSRYFELRARKAEGELAEVVAAYRADHEGS